MHIAHVIEPMEHGVFIWVVDMANKLVKSGYKVTVIHSIRKLTPKNWREMFDPRVTLIHLQMSRSIDPIIDTKALIGLYQHLKRINPDVIHGHSSKSGFLARAAGFLLRKNHKVLYTSHAIHYPLIRQPMKRQLYKILELLGYYLGGTIVACSKKEYEIIRKEITSGKTQRLIRISNGIDTDQTIPKDYSIKNNKVKIGVLGRISEQKAPWEFATIAKSINAKRNDIEFIWVGGGEHHDVANLEQNGIRVTGMLSRKDALKEVSALDIFLQTSLYEGLSLALLEAQVAGIPAVVTNIPGNDEVVQHQKTGYVGNSTEELEKFTEKLIDSAELRQKMGKEAMHYAKKNFSFDVMGDIYKQRYQYIAENSDRSNCTATPILK
ncbi:MAG TPA: glycosyltransferase family 1 protein [Leucothrix mucor]|uniref:Glycosyltransferase family 1 protein n=1 Tax=Leucothrix mucor TaxID=45248 RepID=A0A7V2SY83_LEUMU|nr:glycosyltransferase family 1 protein [Leucothrix mucor]